MSLLIVGSCSRVTQGIVTRLTQLQLYQNITILDLLPTYHFHHRYYRLRKELASQNSSINVEISKLISPSTLDANIKSHRDLLYVTHDYFEGVTSKHKLMELTARLSQGVLVVEFRKNLSLQLLSNMTNLVKKTLRLISSNLRTQSFRSTLKLPL